MINKIKNVKNVGIIASAGVLATGVLSTVVVIKAKKMKKEISKEAQQVITQEKTVELLEKINNDLEDVKRDIKQTNKDLENIRRN